MVIFKAFWSKMAIFGENPRFSDFWGLNFLKFSENTDQINRLIQSAQWSVKLTTVDKRWFIKKCSKTDRVSIGREILPIETLSVLEGFYVIIVVI